MVDTYSQDQQLISLGQLSLLLLSPPPLLLLLLVCTSLGFLLFVSILPTSSKTLLYYFRYALTTCPSNEKIVLILLLTTKSLFHWETQSHMRGSSWTLAVNTTRILDNQRCHCITLYTQTDINNEVERSSENQNPEQTFPAESVVFPKRLIPVTAL